MKRSSYDETKAYNLTSLVDVLKYAGYRTIWFDNDGGCKGVCDRVRPENIDPNEPDFKGLCKNGTCYDEVLRIINMNMKCLTEHAKLEFSHDNFYHSLLGILDANTSFYDEKLDLFSPCRKWERSPK